MTQDDIVRVSVDEVVTLVIPPRQQESNSTAKRETVLARDLYRFEVINSVVGASYTMVASPADSSQYDLHLRLTGQVLPSCSQNCPTHLIAKTGIASFQKNLSANTGVRTLRFDRCINVPIFGGVFNLNALLPMNITLTFNTIQNRGPSPPCTLGPLVPGYVFEKEVFTSPIISDFQVDVSNRRNIAPSVPTLLSCAWVSVGDIPSRFVRVEIWKDDLTIVASSEIVQDIGTANVTLTSSFPNSKNLKLVLVRMVGLSSQTLIISERFFSFGAGVPPVSSSPLRLATTLSVDSYGIMREELQSFDGGIENFQISVLSSPSFTARTNVYVSTRRNLVVIAQRGTVGVAEDWDVNYNTAPTPCSNFILGCVGQTTQGLGTEYSLTASALKDKLILLGANNLTNEFTILVTGHSQGGALAALTALDISLTFQIPTSRLFLVTLGLPVFSDTNLAAQLQSRVTNFAQLVTRDQIMAPDTVTLYSKFIYGTNFVLSPLFPQHFLSYTRLATDDSCILSSLCPGLITSCESCFGDLTTGNTDAHEPRNYLEQVIVGNQTGGSNLDLLPPLNDFCQYPTTIGTVSAHSQSIFGATIYKDPTISCGVEVGATTWYQFAPQQSGFYTIDSCMPLTTISDTVISIFEGNCQNLTQITCGDDQPIVNSCGPQSRARVVEVSLSQTKPYLIAVSVIYHRPQVQCKSL